MTVVRSRPAPVRAVAAPWLLSVTALLAGCGVMPQPSDPLAALNGWPPSASAAVSESVITATYENWPLDGAPRVYACAHPPAQVFGPPPAEELLVANDPSCVPFAVTLNGRRLTTRLDLSTLPAGFPLPQFWSVILAVKFNDASWEASTTLPIAIQQDPGPS